MVKVNIISGFLGAGKTTLIKKLLTGSVAKEKIILLENEYGEVGVDGSFMKDSGIIVDELNSGCICCTLVGDFTKALKKVMEEYAPDRIIIEPSGVGKLSDVAHAVEQVEGAHIGAKVTVVDAGKCRMYMRNFGEFFNDQVENADLIVMSRTDTASAEKILAATELLKQLNAKAGLISTPWDKLSGEQIVEAMEHNALHEELEHMEHEHHHEHEHDHEHHHHDHDEHDEHCTCGCHDHDHDHHHHHHHADEVFTSWGIETPNTYSAEDIEKILTALDSGEYGAILRAKGMVPAPDGTWVYYDYVPEEHDIRSGKPEVTGKICVIGSKLDEDKLAELFHK